MRAQGREWFKSSSGVAQHHGRQARHTCILRCVKAVRSTTSSTSGLKVVQEWFTNSVCSSASGSKLFKNTEANAHNGQRPSQLRRSKPPTSVIVPHVWCDVVQQWLGSGACRSANGSSVVQKWFNTVGVKRATLESSAASKHHGAQRRPRVAHKAFKNVQEKAIAPPRVLKEMVQMLLERLMRKLQCIGTPRTSKRRAHAPHAHISDRGTRVAEARRHEPETFANHGRV